MPIFTNADGLEVRFGVDVGRRGGRAGVTTGAGKRRELVLEIDLPRLGLNGTGFTSDLNNDGINEAFNPSNTDLPIGVFIESVRLIEIVPAAGGTSFTIGAFREAGTVVNVSGIALAGGAAGALIGTQVPQATGPFFVAPVATGTFTAGRFKAVIAYITQ